MDIRLAHQSTTTSTEELGGEMKAKPLTNTKFEHSGHVILCPGCGYWHLFDKRWSFNGDEQKPTFSPSMLVFPNLPEKRCHSFVRDGKIEFLDDCFHNLKGQTVELPDADGDEVDC